MVAVAKAQLTRFHIQVAAEDSPEQTASYNEVLAVFLEVRLLGPT
jgi:hypothetical protein